MNLCETGKKKVLRISLRQTINSLFMAIKRHFAHGCKTSLFRNTVGLLWILVQVCVQDGPPAEEEYLPLLPMSWKVIPQPLVLGKECLQTWIHSPGVSGWLTRDHHGQFFHDLSMPCILLLFAAPLYSESFQKGFLQNGCFHARLYASWTCSSQWAPWHCTQHLHAKPNMIYGKPLLRCPNRTTIFPELDAIHTETSKFFNRKF